MNRVLSTMVLSLWVVVLTAQTQVREGVEVLYFHGKQRCATCMAIEKAAREVVETDFAEQKRNGKVQFRVVDISTPEGAKLAKEYRVTWSSLYVNGWKGGKENRNDLTQFGFRNARTKTAEFKKGVRDKINELLKQ